MLVGWVCLSKSCAVLYVPVSDDRPMSIVPIDLALLQWIAMMTVVIY
jgi:hypothetical protein